MQNSTQLKQEGPPWSIGWAMLQPRQIAALRERLALSQAEMAALMGVSSRLTVSQWECGSSVPGGPVMRFLSLLDSLSSSELRTVLRHLEKIHQDESKAHAGTKAR